MRENPTWASSLGDRRYNDRWPDFSLAAIERSHEEDARTLEKLEAVDRSQLPAAEQLNYDLFRQQYRDSIEGHRFRGFLMALDQQEGIQTADELRDSLRFQTEKDYQDWIVRLRGLGAYVDQTIAVLEQGIAQGRTQPRVPTRCWVRERCRSTSSSATSTPGSKGNPPVPHNCHGHRL